MFTVIITVINACFMAVSVTCAIFSARQTKIQTDVMKEQLEESRKPDYPLTTRLEGISRAIYTVSSAITDKDYK